MFQYRTDISACILFFLLSLLVFSKGLSIHGLEYRDDEIFYYTSTQEMLHQGNFLSPTYFGEDRFQKPILYYWFVLISYKILGVNWPAARAVAVVFAGLSVCVTWLIGKLLFNRGVASLSALILITIPLFFRHARNAVPDMSLNFFIIWAILCAVCFLKQSSQNRQGPGCRSDGNTYSRLFFIACALGFMVKGFTAIIFPFLIFLVYCLIYKKKRLIKEMRFFRGLGIILLIISPWFIYMTAAHGSSYLNYMLIDETKNRLLDGAHSNLLVRLGATFVDHSLFYAQVIGAYFAPWCLFLVGAIPLAIVRAVRKGPHHEALTLMLIWFFSVYCFFSLIYFSINHYLLALSTPFAILISYYFLEPSPSNNFLEKSNKLLRIHIPIIIFILTSGVYLFVWFFLAGGPQWLLWIFLLLIVISVMGMYKSPGVRVAPVGLALLLALIYAQSTMMDRAGVTSHSVLQRFAGTVHAEIERRLEYNAVIGIGSHDIHEKEFQVYFDRRVIKAAGSTEEETLNKLRELLSVEGPVYCLLTEKDYHSFLGDHQMGSVTRLQEDYTFRRRMYLDQGFIKAVFILDRDKIRHYLKEKILLVRKEQVVRTVNPL